VQRIINAAVVPGVRFLRTCFWAHWGDTRSWMCPVCWHNPLGAGPAGAAHFPDPSSSLAGTQGGAAGGSAGALGGTGSGQHAVGGPGASGVANGAGAQQVLGGSEASRWVA
jgi:hypothetical protein